MMLTPDLFIGFLIAISIIALLAQRTHISYPVAFLLGGIALGCIPQIPKIHVPSQYMLAIFLPPLLMDGAFLTSYRDFKRNLRPILQLSTGLVITTSIAVAFLFERMIPGSGWILGLVLGAIISPPDAVAAISIIKGLRVPKRIVTVLEGESLLNDAMGLVLYKLAVGVVVSESFSALSAMLDFCWMVVCGIATGGIIGILFVKLYPKIKEPSVEILSTFLVAYLSYIAADFCNASGVLSVVTTGMIIGWYAPTLFRADIRMSTEAVWEMVVFLLNGIVFLMIGLSAPAVLKDLSSYTTSELAEYAGLVCAATVIVRIVYVYALTYGTRFFIPGILKRDPYPPVQNVFVIAWTGMRGVVSLATALALPLTVMDGTPFPHRSLIIFLALSVIIFTLVFQGLSLPWLLRLLPLSFNMDLITEDWQARVKAAKKALEHVNSLTPDNPLHLPAQERIRNYYEDRLRMLGEGPSTPLFPTESPTSHNHPLLLAENKLWQEAIEVERSIILGLRKDFKINDDILNDIFRELDLAQRRFS